MRYFRFLVLISLVIFLFFQLSGAGEIPEKRVLTIDECIEVALKNNFSVRQAAQKYDAAKWELVGAWSGFLPQVNASFGWDTYDVPSYTFSSGRFLSISPETYSWGIRISQNLFDGGGNLATYNIKRTSKKSAKEGLKIARLNTVLAVKENCYAFMKAKMLYEAQKDAVKRSEEQLNLAKARFDLGSASLSDYLKAKVQLANDSLSLITYENGVRSAQENLNYVLRIDLDTPIEVAAELGYGKFEENKDESIKAALLKHPEAIQAKAFVDIARSTLTQARSNRFPSISFTAGYSWDDNEFPDSWNNYRKIRDPWRIGFNLDLNIFDGFSITSGIQSAKATLREEEEKFAQRKKELELEIRQSFLKVEEAEKKIQVTEQALEAADQDLKLTQEKYNLGAASMLELLDANVSYKTAKNNQVEALYDYNLAVARFEKAIGK